MKHMFCWLFLFVFAAGSAGCTFTGDAKNFNGLNTPAGKPIAHKSVTNVGVHLLFKEPLIGDATLEKTVNDFTAKAKAQGASQVRIVQSRTLSLWFVMPPVSFFLVPTITNVAGDVIE